MYIMYVYTYIQYVYVYVAITQCAYCMNLSAYVRADTSL